MIINLICFLTRSYILYLILKLSKEKTYFNFVLFEKVITNIPIIDYRYARIGSMNLYIQLHTNDTLTPKIIDMHQEPIKFKCKPNENN